MSCKWWYGGFLVCLGLFTVGCGAAASGPQRFRVSGAVTYAGKPVPEGEILFIPSSGPGAVLIVKDGRYSSEESNGVTAGEHQVKITGRTGGDGGALSDSQPLFRPYDATATVTPSTNVIDFNIPEIIR